MNFAVLPGQNPEAIMADVADEQPSRRVRHAFLALNLRHRVYWENLRNLWEIIPSHQWDHFGVFKSRGDIGGKGRLKMKRQEEVKNNDSDPFAL